jgi:predicted HAD superfamily Cof-like phosphohydrolase
MTLKSQVTEFHKLVGQPILETPTVPSDEHVRLRAALITEEYLEVMQSLFKYPDEFNDFRDRLGDIIRHMPIVVDMFDLADGLADLDYVVEGTRLEFGIDGGPIAAEVHAANMRKLGGSKNAQGKILKPEGWTPPDIEGVLKRQGWKP